MRSHRWACTCSWTCRRSRWSAARALAKVPCSRTLWASKYTRTHVQFCFRSTSRWKCPIHANAATSLCVPGCAQFAVIELDIVSRCHGSTSAKSYRTISIAADLHPQRCHLWPHLFIDEMDHVQFPVGPRLGWIISG